MEREGTVRTHCCITIISDHIGARMAFGAAMTLEYISARMT
jgi:hypothetical protein